MASSFDWDEWDADAFDLDAAASHGLHLGDPEPARDSFQGPQNDEPNPFDDVAPSEKSWYWKCLACDSAVSAWDGEMWRCSRCNSKDFYQTDRPAKRFTSDGTWMFMPHGHGQDSKPRRRRRKKHPHPDDTGSEWIDERGEEESKTTDPCVDPEPLHPGSQRDNPHEDQPHRRLPEPRALRNDQVRLGGGSGTQRSTDGQLLKALQSLVTSKKQDDDWASASGPQKGVRWRGGAPPQPPIWRYDKDDLRAYSKYVKKIDIWKLQVAPFMSRKEMALALYNSLQGEAEQELEYTPIEEFYVDDGVEKIVAALKGPMEQKAVYQKRKFLSEFENIRRYAGETMRSYVNRYRRTQRCLKSVGVDVSLTYDQESMGSRLLDRSGLSQEGQRLILVGTQQKLDFELVVESMMLQYPEFRGAPPVISRDGSAVSKGSGKGSGRTMSSSTTASSSSSMASSRSSSSTGKGSFGKGSFVRKQVHVTEIDQGDQQEDEEFLDPIEEGDEQNDVSDQNQPDDDGQTYDEDADQQEDLDLGELAQVLTLTAKKLSNVTLGRKFTGRPKPKPKQKSKLTPEDKPNTHCSACGGLGHWKDDPECPKNGGSGGPAAPRSSGDKKNAYGKPAHRVGIIHHEHGSLEINTPTSETTYANMFTSFMTIHQPFSVHDVNIATSESLIGYVILDTGCQRTCCGARWLQGHSKLLRRFGLHPKVIQHYDEFKFGKGDVSYAHDKAYFPSAINGCGLILAASVLEEDIPFLISNSLLTYLGGIFNLVTDEIYFQKLGIGTKIHRKCGHLVMNIAEFCAENPSDWQVWQQLSHPDLWKDPPPECLVPQDRIVTLSPTDQFANASAAAMLVAEVEEVGLQGKEPHEDGVGQLDDRHQNENPSSKRASSLSSGGRRSPTKPSFTYPSSHEATRECPRSVRNMHRLQDVMEVDRKSENVGTSWTARTLFGIASLAVAIFGNGDQSSGIRQASSSGEIPSKVPPYTSHYIPDETFGINEAEVNQFRLDNLQPRRHQDGSSERQGPIGSLSFGRDGEPTGSTSSHMGRACLAQRGVSSGEQGGNGKTGGPASLGSSSRTRSSTGSGRRDLRLGDSGGGPILKSGSMKQLRGQWKKSALVLSKEHKIYLTSKPASVRPPPNADLWELFAGRALCTELASEYGLNALQPWDLVYGQDLMKRDQRQEALNTLRRLKPYLTLLGLDCRHYTLFNKNLNYSHRPQEWLQLQRQDKPMLDFTVCVAEEQLQSGRYFLIENPLRSELWQQTAIQKLQRHPDVWLITCDSGAFGAEVNGKPIAKPFRFMGNMPGLDEALNQRLDIDQRKQCQPIEGSITRASQEYPEELCRCILSQLQELVRRLEPSRFCQHTILAAQQPTSDLSQWDDVVDHIDKTYERASKRPYAIPPDSSLGKTIQDLFRIDAIRIQVVSNPTTRRIPSNVDEYYTRAAFLLYNDNSRAVEVEDLGDIQFPKQRFTKAVRIAVFAYGERRALPDSTGTSSTTRTPTVVPNMPTDIDFPGLSTTVPQETRAAIARLHLNMGHPSRQELCRLLAYEGDIPESVYECARKLRCATCERLRPPQQPRPSTKPHFFAGQFGDELQMDVFYCRTLTGHTFATLGMVDRATGFHQACIINDRNSDHVFEKLEDTWFKPYGLPLRIMCDPDTSFKGSFQQRVQALGCVLEHCPAEAHHIIGAVERRNAILRIVLEKLIDQFGATEIPQCETLLSAACHAVNGNIHTHGRSAYQAVFGRQPRLLYGNFGDPNALASSPPIADLRESASNLPYKAELIRAEAIKTIHDLDVSSHLRRALLRKTRITKIADVLPGQKCAYWRWSKRGQKKRGSWVMARFLSWDPSAVGKQAWLKTGGSTTLVTAEQLRCAFGFEDWSPNEEDVEALKNASENFSKHLLDDRGPPPDQPQLPEQDEIIPIDEEINPLTPSMMVPAPQTPALPSSLPHQPSLQPQLPPDSLPQQPIELQQHQQTTATSTVNIHIDSPTHISNQMVQQQQQFHRYGDMPQTRRSTRSRTPTSKRRLGRQTEQAEQPALSPPAEQTALLPPAELQAVQDQDPVGTVNSPQANVEDQQQHERHTPLSAVSQVSPGPILGTAEQTAQLAAELPAGSEQQQTAEQTLQADVQQQEMEDGILPAKRPFDSIVTLMPINDRMASRIHPHWDGSPPLAYGPASRRYHRAYLTSQQRQQDVASLGKDPRESDTSQDSSTDDDDCTQATQQNTPAYKQGMTRQELKALDREIPWRKIMEMPQPYVDKFLAAIQKEAESWSAWQSVEPLSDAEANKVYSDEILSKRILRSRACYRDKNCGVGDVKAKCRIVGIVALGHLDPDLETLTRNAATPGRVAEHIMYLAIVAGWNGELLDTPLLWKAWVADAATAFLQGTQEERKRPLFLKAPSDGLISQTSTWKSKLYRIRVVMCTVLRTPQ